MVRLPTARFNTIRPALELERASIGQAVDRLEELGLVERRGAKIDRRVWHIHLMPAAIELLPTLRAEAEAIYHRLLTGISRHDLERLDVIVTVMRGNLESD